MTCEISNAEDVIDSRDVIDCLDELEDDRTHLVDALDELRDNPPDAEDVAAVKAHDEAVDRAEQALAEWDDGCDYRALKALADEAEDYAEDWRHGATLVRESYWTDYVREMLADIGDLPRDLPGYIVIDWEATARNIRADYTEVDFGGVTYLIR
jgi:hypothetical protein